MNRWDDLDADVQYKKARWSFTFNEVIFYLLFIFALYVAWNR